jgi:hypothetical protein
MAELGAFAKDEAAKERPAVARISLKSGVMSYQQQPIPGNKMEVVLVGGAYRNVFYVGRYDPNNIVNPDCYALSDHDEGMEPHENVNTPQHESCDGCPQNEWGSSPTGGRGKACKQTRRLILLPANTLNDADSVLKAELAILDVPVTSVKNYAKLVSTVAATINLPVWAIVTTVAVLPDAKTQFRVEFTPMRPAGNEEIIRALMKRRDEALRIALTPYRGSGGEDDPEAGEQPTATLAKRKF